MASNGCSEGCQKQSTGVDILNTAEVYKKLKSRQCCRDFWLAEDSFVP